MQRRGQIIITDKCLSVSRGFLAAIRHDPSTCHVLAPRFFKGICNALCPRIAGSSINPQSFTMRGLINNISSFRTRQFIIANLISWRCTVYVYMKLFFMHDALFNAFGGTRRWHVPDNNVCRRFIYVRVLLRHRVFPRSTFGVSRFPVLVCRGKCRRCFVVHFVMLSRNISKRLIF